MFRYIVLLALLVCCASSATDTASAQDEGGNRCLSFDYNRQKYTTCYSDRELAGTPTWNPEAAEPQFSRKDALKASRDSLAKYVAVPARWQVESVTLSRVGGAGKWVYEVGFGCPSKECGSDYRQEFIVVVNMGGAVIEPNVSAK
jgi:hypothetical protein